MATCEEKYFNVLTAISIFHTDLPTGVEELWVLGDEFVARSGHVLETKDDSYATTNFEVRAIGSSIITSNKPLIQDSLTRIRNTLVKGLRRYNTVPKIIVIVPEDDIIKAINRTNQYQDIFYSDAIEWLMSEFRLIIQEFRRLMPARAKKGRAGWPHYLWVAPSLHTNYSDENNSTRKRFTKKSGKYGQEIYPRGIITKNKACMGSTRHASLYSTRAEIHAWRMESPLGRDRQVHSILRYTDFYLP